MKPNRSGLVSAVLTGVLVATVILLLAAMTIWPKLFGDEELMQVDTGLFRNNFASRWDGQCTGWTRALAKEHVEANIIIYYCYMTMAFIIAKLHPATKRVAISGVTLMAMFGFIFLCAMGHLAIAYTTINPVYVVELWAHRANAAMSAIACVLVAVALELVRRVIKREEEEVARHFENRNRGRP